MHLQGGDDVLPLILEASCDQLLFDRPHIRLRDFCTRDPHDETSNHARSADLNLDPVDLLTALCKHGSDSDNLESVEGIGLELSLEGESCACEGPIDL